MELDELKDLWKKSGFQPKAESEIASMLRGSSKSIIDKLKRSVWIELAFTLIAGIGLLVYALTLPSGALKWTSVSIIVLFVGYTVYYIKKLMLLNRFNPGEGNMKENLAKLIQNLTSYLKFYKRSYSVLYPVYFCLALLFGGVERGFSEFINAISQLKTILLLAALALFFFFCSTWLVNWFLKKLYGNHLEKLKGLYRELEGHEPQEA